MANSQRYYSAPYQPYQNTAYGQASQGQAPYYKQTNYGQEPKYDQAGYGQEAYYGQASYGQEAYYGQDTYYDQTPYGQDNYYQPRNTLGGDPYEHLTQAATWTKWIAPILSGIVFIACLVILLKLLS
ncbi:MAG: hypothetical protein Q4D97_02615 [Eubacteriales bacterium]|nr:hypothetical protein [Eubacteriales bacterium]